MNPQVQQIQASSDSYLGGPSRASSSVRWVLLLVAAFLCTDVRQVCAESPASPSTPKAAPPYIANALEVSELTFDSTQTSDEERKRIKGLIDGLLPGVTRIQSGHVLITGSTSNARGDEQPYDAELYFDFPTDRVKWSIRWSPGNYGFVRNLSESITLTDRAVRPIVKPRTEQPSIKFAQPLDPRALPYSPMLFIKVPMPVEKLRELLTPFLDLEHVARFRQLNDEAVELVFLTPAMPAADGQAQSQSWIRYVLDVRSGGNLVVAEEWIRDGASEAPHLHWRTTTSWQEFDSLWVPVDWHSDHPQRMTGTLHLDWKSVNQEIAETQFQFDIGN